MTNLIELIKINLLGLTGINKSRFSKNHKEKKNAKLNAILLGSTAILFCYYIYMFADSMMEVFILLNKPEYLLVIFMLICSSYILIANIFKGPQTIFKFKDYDLLLSLPIKKRTVILSKLISLYLYNLLFQLIILVPAFIVYVQNIPISFVFVILYVITFFIIPIIPIIIATLLGTIINYISSKLKFKSFSNILFSLLLVAGIMYANYKFNLLKMDDIVVGQINIVDKLKYFYPMIYLYLRCLEDLSIMSLLLMLLSTIGFVTLFFLLISRYHSMINQSLTSESKHHFKFKKIKEVTPFMALYKKEIKRYLSSPVYVLNTAIGLIFMVIGVIALAFMGVKPLEKILEIPDLSAIIQQGLPFIITLFCTMTCTTHCALSLEGKHFWIIRSLPVSFETVILAKILLNLSLCFPAIIVCGTALNFILDLSWGIRILLYVTPMIATILIALIGITLDILFIKLNWDNEVIIIKQRIPALVTVFIGIFLGIIPLVIKYNIKNWLYVSAITLIYMTLGFIMIYLVKKISANKLKELN